jgi:ribose transport system substrate-binding protein
MQMKHVDIILPENLKITGEFMKKFLQTMTMAATVRTLLILPGCKSSTPGADSQSQDTAAPTPPRLRVAVIPKGLAHAFWKSVRRGAEDAGKELNVEIDWNGPATEQEIPRQVTIVETAITQGVDGIVLAPIDRKALVGAIDKAAKAKIPVVLFDSDADTKNKVSFVATDNYKGGRLAALYVGKITKGEGVALVVPVQPNSQSTGDREKGFEETMHKEFPKIKVIRSNYGMSNRTESMAAAENALTAHPEVTVVFGPNESSAVGALQALRSRHLTGKITLVGFDSADILVDALKSGDIKALAVQNPYKMGYEGVKAIVDLKAGRDVQPRIDTGVKLITQAEMDTPENQKMLTMK